MSTVSPTEDTYIDTNLPNTNYSNSNALKICFVALNSSRALFKFDMTQIANPSQAASVFFTGYINHILDSDVEFGLIQSAKRNITGTTWNKWNGVDDWSLAHRRTLKT